MVTYQSICFCPLTPSLSDDLCEYDVHPTMGAELGELQYYQL